MHLATINIIYVLETRCFMLQTGENQCQLPNVPQLNYGHIQLNILADTADRNTALRQYQL